METTLAPLFEVRPLAWNAPDPTDYDALLLTSANAPRHAGPELTKLAALPCYCVGEGTAAEAVRRGCARPTVGPGDAAALLTVMAAEGVRAVLHLRGRDHIAVRHSQLSIHGITVYAAEPADRLPHSAITAIEAGALALLHSPRAACCFGELVGAAGLDRGKIRIAAISEAAADAAGPGWASRAIADAPRDQALLELAAKLCNTARVSGTGLTE